MSWAERGACVGKDPRLWDVRRREDNKPDVSASAMRDAARICQSCPVRLECATDAEVNGAISSIRAGIIWDERGRRTKPVLRSCKICGGNIPVGRSSAALTCSESCSNENDRRNKAAYHQASRGSFEGRAHGDRVTYNLGCRCDPCSEANRAYRAEHRMKEPASPGAAA